jgi:hypothetical protein
LIPCRERCNWHEVVCRRNEFENTNLKLAF